MGVVIAIITQQTQQAVAKLPWRGDILGAKTRAGKNNAS
jgi:hypothetical protein